MPETQLLEVVKNVGDKLNGRLDDVTKLAKEQDEKLKRAAEQLKRLGGDAIEGDATLAETVAAQQKLVKELREGIEQYTRQMPAMAKLHGGQGDPEYDGFWPSAEKAALFGQYVMAGLHQSAEQRRVCAESLVESGIGFRDDRGAPVSGENYVKAMVEGTDTIGGYLVPEEFMATIIKHVNEYGVARSRLLTVPMSRERQTWPKRTGGLTVYYPDEGNPPTESTLTFGKVALVAKKWSVYTSYTKELEEDAAVGLGEYIANEMALALAIAEDTNCFMGDGTSAYAGIVGVLGSANVATVTMAAGKTGFEDVDHDELTRLKYAVPAWVRKMPDCGYYMCSGIAGICERLLDGDGRPLYQIPTESHPLRIAGKEVVETEVMPDTDATAVSTKFIAFGSLRAWGMLGQRRGMTIDRSDQVFWREGMIAIKVEPRQDIQEAVGEAMAVLRTAAA